MIKERTRKYEISVKPKKNGYYIARVSLSLGGGSSNRYEKSGTTDELALIGLLDLLISSIDTEFKIGNITCKFDDRIPQRIISSINETGLTSPIIMEKTLLIVNKINNINAHILNNISLQNNIIPFYNPNSVQITNTNNTAIMPTQANIVNTVMPVIHNVNNNEQVPEPIQQIIIEDLAIEWKKYELSLCKKTKKNPNPLSQKTIDGYCSNLNNIILPYCKDNKKIYLSQLTEDFIEKLLDNINGQTAKKHAYIVLNMIFKYAIKEKDFKYNPIEKIDKPVQESKTEEEKDDYIEPDKQDIYLDIFEKENTDMSILFFTMLLTGIRPEEACGLKWKALDLENGELIINNAYKDFIVYDENMEPKGHIRRDDKLKTPESYRRIPLNPRLVEVLLKHKENQKERFKNFRKFKKNGRKWSENDYMFLGRHYEPYVADTLSSGLRDFCIEKKLNRVTPYTLRRSFATFCAERGMKENILMRLMRTFFISDNS